MRELHEELGIEVKFQNRLSLGVIPSCMKKANFIDECISVYAEWGI
ncbi:hypothetical protein AAGS61_07735 [Lysinibacillus sp. KU-BSD001]